MRVLRLHGVDDLRLHEEPFPEPEAGEALLAITAVGICGSDIHWYKEGTTGEAAIESPFVLGHEFSAVVQNGELAGRRVAVEPHIHCGRCVYCQEGNPNLCPYDYFAGQAPTDGALRQYMTWPEELLFPIPDSMSDQAAAMLEPLGVALHTVDLGKLRPGMRVGVYGCGPVGLMVVQLARLSGAAQIIATDLLPRRMEAAQRAGATLVLQADAGGEIPAIMEATGGQGVDVAFEVAGEQDAVDTAVESVEPGGAVILCGIPSVDLTSFKASTARRKGLTFKTVRRMKHTYPRAIRLVESGLVDVDSLVTHHYALEDSIAAFDAAEARQGLKIVINP